MKVGERCRTERFCILKKVVLSQWPDGAGESTFLEFFGSSPILSQSVVSKHKLELEVVTKLVIDRADQYEAHIDKNTKLR